MEPYPVTETVHFNISGEFYGITKSELDKIVDTWLFMASPIYPISLLVLYLLFVLKLGPHLMKDREPFKLGPVLLVYNAFLVLLSASIVWRVLGLNAILEVIKHCNVPDAENNQYIYYYIGWWYLISKVVELLDTVFFVLRKKQSQVTFLHVYHHSLLMISSWVYVKYVNDSQGPMIALINSTVHVVMYAYYFMSALEVKQQYLWWKKYVTWMQLIQFGIGFLNLAFKIMKCHIPAPIFYFYLFNNTLFAVLFLKFYIKAYLKKIPNVEKTK